MTTSLCQIVLLYMVVALLPTLTLEVEIQISLLRDGGEENSVTFRRTSNAKPTVISQSKDNGNDNDKFVSVSRLNALVTQRLSNNDDDTTNHEGDERENESSRMGSLPRAEAQMQEENWSDAVAPRPPSPPPPPPPFAISPFNRPTLPKNSHIQTEPACGGILKSRHGIIQTPHFPKQFPIPIECVWIIDASELAHVTDNATINSTPNVSIIVYLTQLYVLGGLKFTEYMYYSDDYKVPSHRVFQLTEDDVTQIAWIQFNSQYLEIKFQMSTLDGTQLRALDRLLDVYGFNITYEVDTAKSYQCNALQCRFLGHCYATREFTGYYCSCFAGFSGSDCGHGPLCEDPHTNFCQNGGTCKHIGDAAVTCHCPSGFKGNKCEIPEIGEITMGCTENSSSSDCYKECDFGNSHGLLPTTRNRKNFGRNGKTRFEVTIRLGSNLTNFYRTTTENERKTSDHLPSLLERHLSRVLRNFNITRINDLELISNSDSLRIRDAITRMVERGRIGNITLVSNFHLFDENPPFKLLDIRINQNSAIREDSEFIISCIAQGSSKMQFQWYKDGAIVNATIATREMWTTVLPPESKDVYTAILGITKANRMDEGIYSCKVVDWGVEQCRSLYVHIKSPPRLRVDPASVTLHRGDSLRVRCLSPGNDIKRYGQLGYSWTRNGALFQSNPLTVMWEDLYPDGSILKINNIQKSAEYTCIVSNSVKPISKSVYVTVIDRDATIQICHAEKDFGIRWPSSAPGAAIITDCPKRYVGYSRRICEKRDVGNSTWLQPDFSHCIADQMLDIYNKFRALTSGYQMTNCSAILKSSLDYTNGRNIKFLPGEAGFLIDLLQEVEKYLELKGSHLERGMAAEIILHILDRVMQNVLSLNSQQQIRKLQLLTQSAALNRETIAASQLAVSTTGPAGSADVLTSSGSSSAAAAAVAPISSSSSSSPSTGSKQSTKSILTGGNIAMATIILDEESLSLDRLSSLRIYMTAVKMLPFHLKIYGDDLFSDQLYMDIALSNRLHNIMANSTIFASVISYKNLKNFLPKTYYSRGSETKDTDYVLASRIVQTWLFQSNRSNDNLREPLDLPFDVGHVEIIFQHESALKDSDWIPVCGHDAKATFESTWRTDSCITKNLMDNITRCICPLSGTFVVMLTKRNHNSTITRPSSIRSFFVIISCGCCLLQSFAALAILLPIWYNRRCAITFLKIQFCVSTSSVMIIYLLGFLKMLPQSWQAIISSTLASLMLLGLSTLIAISLVVHSELMPKRLLITTAAAADTTTAGVNNATSAGAVTSSMATTKILTNNQQQKQHQQQRRQQLLLRGSARATAAAAAAATVTTTTTTTTTAAEQFCRHNNYYNASPGISGTIGISWLLPLLYAICAPLICSIIGKWPQNWWIEVITPAAAAAADAASAVTFATDGMSITTTIDRSLSSTRYTTDNTEPLISTASSSSSSLAISSGFIIFIVIEVLFIILFVLLLVILTKKLLWLLRKFHHHHQHQHHHNHNYNRYNSPIWKRIGLLYRTGIIFLVKLTTDGLFITYANSSLSILWGHLFGLFSILLGFSILFCFVIKTENKNLDSSNNKGGGVGGGGGGGLLNKSSLEDNNYCSDSINSPLNFYANHEKEKDNESGAPLTIVGDDNAGHHLPVTIISTAIPRCQMIAGIPTPKSVGSFLGGIVGETKTSKSGNIGVGGAVGNESRNITSGCLYEVKKFQGEQSKGDNHNSTATDQRDQSSPLSRCCSISILGVNPSIDSTIGNAKAAPAVPSWQSPQQQHNELIHPDPHHSYYDAYGSSSKSEGQHCRLMHHHQYQDHQVNQQQMSRMSAIISDGSIISSPAGVVTAHCPLTSHEFVGVETLDILQGVSTENMICNRTTTTTQLATRTTMNAVSNESGQGHSLHYYNGTQQHHKPFVENVLDRQIATVVSCNNTISNANMSITNKCSNNTSTIATSSVTTQTPKSQKRVTIIETPQIAHTFDPLIPVISVSKSQSIHQSTSQSPLSLAKSATATPAPAPTPTPIITITCSSIDDPPNNNNNNSSNGVDFTINALDTAGNSNNPAIFHQPNVTQMTLLSAQQKNEISPDTEEEENSITGMFDRISHDLDYLLNRTNALPTTKLESEDNDDEIPSEHILHHIPTPPLPPTGSIPQHTLPSVVSTDSISSKHCNRNSIHKDVIIEEPEQE